LNHSRIDASTSACVMEPALMRDEPVALSPRPRRAPSARDAEPARRIGSLSVAPRHSTSDWHQSKDVPCRCATPLLPKPLVST
jgi:hypothetical protein